MFMVFSTTSLFYLLSGLLLTQPSFKSNLLSHPPVQVSSGWHSAYHRYPDWTSYLKMLASQYPKIATYQPSIGTSVEGRDIGVLRVTGSDVILTDKKRAVFVCGQSASAWISIAAPMYAAEQLIKKYHNDARVTSLLNAYEFVFVTIANPDGYEYSWSTDRMWLKNRAKINGQNGVALNRNWDDHWGTGGSSTIRTSNTYAGPAAFSEPETKAISKLIRSTPNLVLVIDFQAHGELILRPYGWTQNIMPDEAQITKASEAAAKSIASLSGAKYIAQRIVDQYLASGTLVDWAYSSTPKGTIRPYTLAIFLSPQTTVSQGLILSPEKIIPVGSDVYQAVLTLGEFCLVNPLSTNF